MESFTMGEVDVITNSSMNINSSDTSTTAMPETILTDEQNVLQSVQQAMFTSQYFTLPVFLVIGLFGNIMTIITMASRQFKNLTSRYILIALSLSDTTLILTQPFNKLWIIKLFGMDLRAAFSDTGCKIFFHIFRTAKMTSSWLVVLLCFERFIAVVFPLRAKFIIKKRVIFPAIALDYLFIGTFNAVWSFSSGLDNGICKPDLPSLQHKYFVIVGCTVYSFLPSAILLVLTPKIMLKILRQIRLRRAMTSSKQLSSSASRKEEDMIRASIMVVGVMIAYIVLVLPITSVHMYSATVGVSAFDVNSLGFFIFREVAQILEQINYAINFFFYILCSGTFRRRVYEILGLSCSYDQSLSRNRTFLKSSSDRMSSKPSGSAKVESTSKEETQ